MCVLHPTCLTMTCGRSSWLFYEASSTMLPFLHVRPSSRRCPWIFAAPLSRSAVTLRIVLFYPAMFKQSIPWVFCSLLVCTDVIPADHIGWERPLTIGKHTDEILAIRKFFLVGCLSSGAKVQQVFVFCSRVVVYARYIITHSTAISCILVRSCRFQCVALSWVYFADSNQRFCPTLCELGTLASVSYQCGPVISQLQPRSIRVFGLFCHEIKVWYT